MNVKRQIRVLPKGGRGLCNVLMLTSKDIAKKLTDCMKAKQVEPPALAELCGVRVPSVYDWMEHGRIAKKHIPKLAAYFGTTLGYWLGSDDDEADLTPKERQLLTMYRSLSEDFRHRLLQDAEVLLGLQPTAKPPQRLAVDVECVKQSTPPPKRLPNPKT